MQHNLTLQQLAKAYNNKAISLAYLERNEEAIIFFKKAIELDPLPKYYTNIGISFSELGDENEAIKYFDIAINLLEELVIKNTNL